MMHVYDKCPPPKKPLTELDQQVWLSPRHPAGKVWSTPPHGRARVRGSCRPLSAEADTTEESDEFEQLTVATMSG